MNITHSKAPDWIPLYTLKLAELSTMYPTSVSGISFIKYQTLNKNILNFIFYRLEFLAISREHFPW